MRVGIATVQVPFMHGGAEMHAQSLQQQLVLRGYEADIITIPFKWYPPERILDSIMATQLLDLTGANGDEIDQLITLKFPMYYIEHPNKVGWILHQHRQAYDLYDTSVGDLRMSAEGRAVRDEIVRMDNLKLPEHRKLFTNAKNTAHRLKRYNGIVAEPLYHPPLNHDAFYAEGYQRYILAPGRMDAMKRQKLLLQARAAADTDWRIIFIGPDNSSYGREVRALAVELGLEGCVEFRGHVSEQEKLALYAGAGVVYNGVLDEDYGYVTLEAFLASRAVITHTDSGGPLEFVQHERNGYITEPAAAELAALLNEIQGSPYQLERLGQAGLCMMQQLNINWDYVIGRLMEGAS